MIIKKNGFKFERKSFVKNYNKAFIFGYHKCSLYEISKAKALVRKYQGGRKIWSQELQKKNYLHILIYGVA